MILVSRFELYVCNKTMDRDKYLSKVTFIFSEYKICIESDIVCTQRTGIPIHMDMEGTLIFKKVI